MSAMSALPTKDTDYNLAAEMAVARKDGSLIRAKARMIVEELFLDQAVLALQDETVSHGIKLDYAKQVIDMADVKPKANAVAGDKPTFSINIVLPSGPGVVPPAGITIDGVPAEPAPIHEDPIAEEADIPGERPQFQIPDFRLTNDLAGLLPT